MVFCSSCGKETDAKLFCPKCGSQLESSKPSPKKSRIRENIGTICGAIGFFIIVSIILYLTST